MATRTSRPAANGRSHRADLFPTRNDLPANVRERIVALLNQQIADTSDLYSQTKQAHWNVKGPEFYQLHLLFDELAEAIEGFVDLIAERYAQYAAGIRQDIDATAEAGDMSTSDLLTEIVRTIDKQLWFLDAHLQSN